MLSIILQKFRTLFSNFVCVWGGGKLTVGAFGRQKRKSASALTTIIPCISASGNFLPPFVILKGKYLSQELRQCAPESYGLVCTKSGYIDKDVFLKCLQHFCKHREKIPSITSKYYLFIDGHASHIGY